MIHSVPLLQETAGGLLEFELLRRLLEQASSGYSLLLAASCCCRWLLQKRRSRTGKHHGTEGRMGQEKVTKNCLTCRLKLLYKQG